jgi:tetratricopeptide (TPR) repeat protein
LKKLALNLSAIFLIFASCHQATHKAAKVDWTTYRIAYQWLSKRQDSAFFYFNRVAAQSRDSLQVAMAYSNMAKIQYREGDFYGAQESLVSSLKFLDEQRKSHYVYLAGDYNDLGLVRADLEDHDGAISFYKRNLRFAQDSDLIALTWNNIAYAYQQKKAYANAISIYRRLLSKKYLSNADYARTLNNLATALWLANTGYSASGELLKALHIRQRANDLWGQNSSFAHLADYYRVSKPDSALFYAKAMYRVAKQIDSPDDVLQALEKLIGLSPVTSVKSYFVRYRQLNDSLQTARNAAKNQFALIRYNVEKSNADNLRLQKDNTEKKYQLIRQSVRFYGTVLVFLLLVVAATLWYKKRKRLQEQKMQDAVEETQLKASKKVHDTLANDIYRIMKRIEHDPALGEDWLLDDIDDVYQRARDLSYEILKDNEAHFHEKIAELLISFASEKTKVVIVGNSEELWQKVNTALKVELKYILQELMVNMQKHSQARNVVVKFDDSSDSCLISYFDDGIGFQADMLPKNGLKNTGNRINAIHGTINFGANTGHGVQIQLSFPIA